MSKPLHVLMIEDSEDDALLMLRELKKGGYEPLYKRVETAETMSAALKEKTWDVILCDYQMPQFNGLAAIALLKETGIDIPIIIVSGAIGEETAADCMRFGAHDYVMKGNLSRLVPATERELKDILVRRARKQAEKEWENIFQAIAHPTLILDPTHGIIAANKAAVCASGMSRTDLIGRQCYDVFHGKDGCSPPPGCPVGKLLVSGQAETLDAEMETLGGVFLVSCTPIHDQQGRVEKIIHIAMDITERKRAEEALRSSERRLSDIIEFFPDATLVIDNEGKVIAWNHAIEIMTGVKAEDMLGKENYEYAVAFYGERRPTLIDIALHPELEREKSYTNFEQKGDILFGESYAPGLFGDDVHLSATASVLRDVRGKIVAAIECIRDDTERKQAQEDLSRAEAEYRSIFENAQEGIFRITPEGQFITANQAMAEMLGHDSPRELFSAITDISRQLYVDPRDLEALKEMIKGYGPLKGYETQLYRKDGSTIWISLNMNSVHDVEGNVNCYEGMMEDITMRRKADEERKYNIEKLRKVLGGTVKAIANTVEMRDPYTAGHQRRVSDLARSVAVEMHLSSTQIDCMRVASIIHDIGKISVPAEILSKPKRLTDAEFSLIKTHCQSGHDILKDIEFPWPVARIILEHHERMDGSGYPGGLTGKNLLVESRILAVADVVEAIASHRPYRPGLGIDAALDEISKNKGILYDAEVVHACLNLFHEKGYTLPV